jgi:protein gp37
MQETNIGWTDFSVNLLKYLNALGKVVWACVHASEGCRFCYSEALAKRWGRGEAFTAENMKLLTPFFDTKEADQVLRSKKIAGKKVFVDDMTDLFGEWVPNEIIDQHFAIFAMRPDVTFQVLTKRAGRMREFLSRIGNGSYHLFDVAKEFRPEWEHKQAFFPFPLKNVHVGVSVEDQKHADQRIGDLVKTPAAVRWVSIEPLLANVSLRWAAWEPFKTLPGSLNNEYDGLRRLNGIVIGGESGAGHREMPLEAALTLARTAHEAGIAVYVKQDSGPRPGMQGRIPDDVWAMKDWPTGV